MDSFVTILGCGSATPMPNAFQTSQVLSLRGHQYMIDCGEGAQNRIIQFGVKISRLNHIFISHLHGDHCFGLVGLISTMGLKRRIADLYIHAQPDLERILKPQFDYFLADVPFKVVFVPFSPYKSAVIHEDNAVKVTTIPLVHRVPTVGFIFEEKQGGRHLIPRMLEMYQIPNAYRALIKNGADYTLPTGEVIPNSEMTTDPSPTKKYVYMSDTAYSEKYIDLVRGADLLYHEATFLDNDIQRIAQTMHSSAFQAGRFAQKAEVKKLIIGHFSSRQPNHLLYEQEAKEAFDNSVACKDGDKFYI